MAITHVLRGEEWLSSTPKHMLLYRAFGWEAPQFAHLPLLLKPDRTKLSKRSNDLFVSSLSNAGMLPAAVTNFVSLLGWTPSDSTQEFFPDLPSLADKFSLEGIHRAGAVVDQEKLLWFQRQHMRALTESTVAGAAKDVQQRLRAERGEPDEEYCRKVVLACRNTFDNLDVLAKSTGFFFSDNFLQSKEYKDTLDKVNF